MTGEKPWYLSRTLWGAFVSAAAALGGTLGIQADAAMQTELVDAIVRVCGALGALYAVYGRFQATERIV